MELQSFYTKMARKIYNNHALKEIIFFLNNKDQAVFMAEILKNVKVNRRRRVRENGQLVFKEVYDYIDRKQTEKCIELLDYMLLIEVDRESFKPNKLIYLNENGKDVAQELEKL